MPDHKAWVIRPYPHGKYRVKEFLSNGLVAIGWPALGDLTGLDREQIRETLRKSYYPEGESRALGQVVGIVDRFVNQIRARDLVVIPDGNAVFFGRVIRPYFFQAQLQSEKEGYPHCLGVKYLFDSKAIQRSELPAVFFDALKGRQSVFGAPTELVQEVVDNPTRYQSYDSMIDINMKRDYLQKLSTGHLPGINSNSFEIAVMKLFSLYFPGLRPLGTRNAPIGADSDLRADLPGQITIRVQVKCFQDSSGPLDASVVTQLRGSMEPGDHGIVVTTSKVAKAAREAAESDLTKPVAIIGGSEFAELLFDKADSLTDKELWSFGLRRTVAIRG